MARIEYWVGSKGPFFFDSAEVYPDGSGIVLQAIRSEGTIYLAATPSLDNHVIRLVDLNTAIAALNAIEGDAAGRNLRTFSLEIENGTAAASLKCRVINRFNGTSSAYQDNILKGATTGNYTLSANGNYMTINTSEFSSTIIEAIPNVMKNRSGTPVIVNGAMSGGNVRLTFYRGDASDPDMTSLLDVGSVEVSLICISSN